MHTPLMLQTVLGLDAACIAQAFLIAPKTMGQRLFRAKTKIRSGGIPFEIPPERDLPERLDAVLEATYAAFGLGSDDMAGADQRGRDLAEEFKNGRVGRFQAATAFQSVHAERARTGRTDWTAIVLFYEELLRISPALGTRAGYAAALAEANGPAAGLAVLESIDTEAVSHYQPYWAVRAHLLQRLGKTREATDAYDRAIGLAEDPAVREFLLHKRG